jgi:hypothetical protein
MQTAILALNVIVNTILYAFLAYKVGVPAFGIPVGPIYLDVANGFPNKNSPF